MGQFNAADAVKKVQCENETFERNLVARQSGSFPNARDRLLSVENSQDLRANTDY